MAGERWCLHEMNLTSAMKSKFVNVTSGRCLVGQSFWNMGSLPPEPHTYPVSGSKDAWGFIPSISFIFLWACTAFSMTCKGSSFSWMKLHRSPKEQKPYSWNDEHLWWHSIKWLLKKTNDQPTSRSWTWDVCCLELWVHEVHERRGISLRTHTGRSHRIGDTIPVG